MPAQLNGPTEKFPSSRACPYSIGPGLAQVNVEVVKSHTMAHGPWYYKKTRRTQTQRLQPMSIGVTEDKIFVSIM